jgi:hypothetical protein
LFFFIRWPHTLSVGPLSHEAFESPLSSASHFEDNESKT